MRLIDPRNISAKRYKEACDDFECGWNACINEIMESVQQIEAEPVRHGRWVETFSQGCWHYDCPFCDDGYATEQREKKPVNFCSNCGAKMDGGAEDDAT